MWGCDSIQCWATFYIASAHLSCACVSIGSWYVRAAAEQVQEKDYRRTSYYRQGLRAATTGAMRDAMRDGVHGYKTTSECKLFLILWRRQKSKGGGHLSSSLRQHPADRDKQNNNNAREASPRRTDARLRLRACPYWRREVWHDNR